MVRFLVVAYLLAHGLVHLAIYVTHPDPSKPQPFDPHHSWALTQVQAPPKTAYQTSVLLAWITTAAFILAAVALATGAGWWPAAAMVAAALGLAFKAAWFNPWLSAGVTLDAALVAAVAAQWPASLY